MILFQNKLLKLVKLAIKLTNKLIFVIGKIEKTYQDAEAKVENLSMKKLDLSNILESLNKISQKLGDKQ